MVQLDPKASHGHILPVLLLSVLVLCVGGPVRVLRLDWQPAIIACLITPLISIVVFYAVLPFIYMVQLKESWVGLGIAPSTTKQLLRITAVLLTYYGFICRVFMISGVEAFFVAIMVAVLTGNQLSPFEHGKWSPGWAATLIVLAVAIHTLVERRNLGQVAIIESPE